MEKILGLLLVVSVVAASCGGDDDESTSTTASTAESTTTTEPTPSSTTTTEPTSSSTATSQSTTSSSTESTTTSSTESTITSSTTTLPDRVIEVYFSTGDGTDCSEVGAFERTVDASLGPARAAFDELIGGPTPAEEAEGAFSFFSATTAGAILSVAQSGDLLTIDLADIRADISNAGTSCGSAGFISSLNATAFQFSTVDRVRYLFTGSCEDFGGFIQTDVCEFDRNS